MVIYCSVRCPGNMSENSPRFGCPINQILSEEGGKRICIAPAIFDSVPHEMLLLLCRQQKKKDMTDRQTYTEEEKTNKVSVSDIDKLGRGEKSCENLFQLKVIVKVGKVLLV